MLSSLLGVATQASRDYMESFTSRLLRPDASQPIEHDEEEEDIIKCLGAGLYAGGGDTVRIPTLLPECHLSHQ